MRKFKLALARIGTKLLPGRLVHWYRRRRALRRYLTAVAYEVYHRQVRIENTEELEGRIAARRDGFYDRLVKEVVDRTDLILQELDRRLEGASSRHAGELRDLKEEIGALRAKLDSLAVQPNGSGRPTGETPGTDRDEAASGSRLLPD